MRGHKRKRPDRGDDAWELIVNAGRDPVSGRRKQVSRLFRGSSGAADTALAGLVTEVTSQRDGPGTDAPVSTLVAKWLDMVADDLSPTTVQGYRRILRHQIEPGIGRRPVGSVTTLELDVFYRELLATPLAPATVRQVHAVLRRAFRQAVRWGWLAVNPAIDATPPVVRRAKVSVPTVAQVRALLTAAAEADPAMGCMFRVAAATGARRGELVGLRWSRVDLVGGSVLIDSTVVEVEGATFEKDTKTHQARRVALDEGTVAALRAHLEASLALAAAVGERRVVDPFVWSSDEAGRRPLRPEVVTGRFRRLAKVHAPGCRLHDLRHFAVTEMLAGGVPVKAASGRVGHGSAAMTLDVYGHSGAPADRDAADLLGGLLDG